jgi:hypothetical protein
MLSSLKAENWLESEEEVLWEGRESGRPAIQGFSVMAVLGPFVYVLSFFIDAIGFISDFIGFFDFVTVFYPLIIGLSLLVTYGKRYAITEEAFYVKDLGSPPKKYSLNEITSVSLHSEMIPIEFRKKELILVVNGSERSYQIKKPQVPHSILEERI